MDTNNLSPPQGGEPGIEGGDWRSQLQPASRQRIINRIMETLKRHLPVSGQEGLSELRKIAVRFEEKIYTAATGQVDYLRKISLKIVTMETRSESSGKFISPIQGNELEELGILKAEEYNSMQVIDSFSTLVIKDPNYV